MSNKAKILWAVHDKRGNLQSFTIRWYKKDCIKSFEDETGYKWQESREYGFTVRKILISNFPEQ